MTAGAAAPAIWPLRSLLFLPAHQIGWVRRIGRHLPDAVILDLEDAVSPARKAEARSLVAEEIGILRRHGVVPVVRINALDDGGEDDVAAIAGEGLASVMLPKVDGPQDVARLDRLLTVAERQRGLAEGGIGVIALPETARGLWQAHAIAGASPRVSGLITAVSGPVVGDVARAFGFQPTEEGDEQLFLQSRTILASRAAGALHPLGTILGSRLDDLEAVRRLTRRARQLGFSGVALIHPSHVAIANEVFRPTEAERAHAQGLIEALQAAEARGLGAVAYRGAMVDAAMRPHALDVLASHARFQQLDARARQTEA